MQVQPHTLLTELGLQLMVVPWPGLASPCSEAESARRVMTHFGVGYFPPSPPLPGRGEPGTHLHCLGPGGGVAPGSSLLQGPARLGD